MGTRASKYKLRARTGKYKLGARAGDQAETCGPGNTKNLALLINLFKKSITLDKRSKTNNDYYVRIIRYQSKVV